MCVTPSILWDIEAVTDTRLHLLLALGCHRKKIRSGKEATSVAVCSLPDNPCAVLLMLFCVLCGQILMYFASLNLHIFEVFGQSECTGPQTHNTKEAWKMGSVGRPMVVRGSNEIRTKYKSCVVRVCVGMGWRNR